MLPPKNRGGRQLFLTPRGRNRRFNNNLFSLEVLELLNNNPPKVAAVVSKKNTKTAVLRNLIKRRIYSIILGELPNINNGAGLIIFTKTELAGVDYQTTKNSLLSLLATTPIYKPKNV